MERFRITLGEGSLVMGVPGAGTLVFTITSCLGTRSDPNCDGCRMSLGGVYGADYFTWPGCELETGDRIEIEILPEGPADDPDSFDEVADLLQSHREAQAAADPSEQNREDVRRGAAALGWTLIGDEASSSSPATAPGAEGPGLSAATLEAEKMERFRVTVRGQTHVIGLPDTGVLSLMLHAVVRQLPDGGTEDECELALGGLRSDDADVDWAKYHLPPAILSSSRFCPKVPSMSRPRCAPGHRFPRNSTIRNAMSSGRKRKRLAGP